MRVKTDKICRESAEAVLAIGFLSVNKCRGGLQSRLLGTVFTPALWLMLVASAFLPCSQLSLYLSAFLVSGWDETETGPLSDALKGWGR